MYVPALLTEETRPEVADFADRFRSRDEMRRQQKERAVDPWEAVRRYHRFVVLGGPGAGKTTYLYHLAFMCAHRHRPEVQDHLPIFIRFRELVKELANLKQLEDAFPGVLANYKFPNAAKYVERRLKEGRCLILLDGLDELSNDADHQKFIELVQRFADRHVRERKDGGKGNILVVSCRIYSYEHGAQLVGFPKTEVMEFDRETVARFAHNYFGTSEGFLANELLVALNRNARFLELARNPLLLLLIAYHYKRERNLPTLRFELYKHCVQTRIIAWNTQKGTHLGRFGETQKSDMLGELALHIFQHEQQGLLSKRAILHWLQNFVQGRSLPDGATPEDLLEETVRTSGLIQEWAIDRYGFSHQTLQEYFAADALWQLGPEEGAARLADHLPNPAWKEVVLLYCGRSKNAAPLMGRLVAQASQPENGQRLWLLAGQCLAEGAQQIPEPLRQEVTEVLVNLLRAADGLTPEERENAVAGLHTFATDLLPGHVQMLLASEGDNDLFLAEQLLPANAPDELRAALLERMVPLSRSADAAVQQATIAAIGRLGGGVESVAALWAG
ncbi:MAG: NACHT domain-containing protein, partial [Chloroflexi bacterium]|nr:NACHT domain-containing protein [Chloroflexota bacterium]NOG36122.1 NACHT domain-containing protein [Chloroflexota bacterium]